MTDPTGLIAQADAELAGRMQIPARQLCRELRDALAAALTRVENEQALCDKAQAQAFAMIDKNNELMDRLAAANARVEELEGAQILNRNAISRYKSRAEAAECHAEAMEAERDKANAEWAEAQSAATYNAEYVDLALEMRARVAVLEAALQPFADAADELDELGMDDPNQQAPVTYDDCVAARAAFTDGGAA